MKDSERLASLKLIYGDSVMYTNGLYHILDNDHTEVYINTENNELDKRAKYETHVVLNRIIVARVTNSKVPLWVVLNKSDLKLIYKTKNKIDYLDDNLLYEIEKGSTENKIIPYIQFVSHTGKMLSKIEYGQSIEGRVNNNAYVIHTQLPYSDKILEYRERDDKLIDITEGKNYIIYIEKENTVEILPMLGGKYKYNFKNHECENLFTGLKERVHLFSINV